MAPLHHGQENHQQSCLSTPLLLTASCRCCHQDHELVSVHDGVSTFLSIQLYTVDVHIVGGICQSNGLC